MLRSFESELRHIGSISGSVVAFHLFLSTPQFVATLESQVPPSNEEWQVSDRPTLVLGAVTGARPDLFGDVAGAVRLRPGRVVVADRMKLDVRVFSADGALLARAGGGGEGPGEFRTIMSIRRCADAAAFVYDPAFPRLTVFDHDGNLLRTIPVMDGGPPPYDFFCNHDRVLAFVHRSSEPPEGLGPHRPMVPITVTTEHDEARLVGTFPASERYFNGSNDFPRPLGKITSVGVGTEVLFVGTGDFRGATKAFEIQIYTFRGRQVGAIRDTALRRPVTARHRRSYIDERVSRLGRMGQSMRVSSRLEALQYPESFPAYGRLVVDPSDNLWVEDYPVPGEDTRTWRVYARGGARIATIEMPPGLRLFEAGDDYVLGVRKNDLDVAFVEMYELTKSH